MRGAFAKRIPLPQAGGVRGGPVGPLTGNGAIDSPTPNPSRLREGSLVCAFLLLAFLPTPLPAQDSLPPAPYAYRQLDDPAMEAKAKALMETLRCLTCQGQSIADSDAPLAGDMRNQVRQRLAAGENPEAIRKWLMERYGDYVSYAPRVTALTWPLFALPLFVLALAALLLRRRFGGGGR